MKLILYGTSACHLCEIAEQLVELTIERDFHKRNISFEKTDIALDDKLFTQYALTIPVLVRLDHNLKLSWPFTIEDIQTIINT